MRRSYAKQKPGGLSPGLSIPASKTVGSKLLAASLSAAGGYFAAVLLMVFSNGL